MGNQWHRVKLAAAASLIGLVSVGVLALVILRYGRVDRARPADVIVVLGAGDSGTERRAIHAAALYHQGYAPVVLCSGGAQAGTAAAHEADWCAQVTTAHGVPPDAILRETRSQDTVQNARECAAIMRARGWSSALVVSDDFHLLRARWLFDRQGVRAWTSPAQITTSTGLNAVAKTWAVLREVAVLGWQAARAVLGVL